MTLREFEAFDNFTYVWKELLVAKKFLQKLLAKW